MSGPRIGVGIVGLSADRGWAAKAHVPALAMLADYELRGLVASSSESSQAAALKHRVPFASNQLDDLLTRHDIDLVVVSVRVPEHRRVVEASLRAGKAVLCEWPLARNLAEAEALAAVAQDAGRPCFVNLQARSSPAVRLIGDLLGQGYVGQVLSTSVIAAAGSPWGAERIEPSEVMYQARENGATMLSIPIAHMHDTLSVLFGELEGPRATLAVRCPQVRLRDSGEMIQVTAHDQVCISGRLGSGTIAALHYRATVQQGTRFLGKSTALWAISWCKPPPPTYSSVALASEVPRLAPRGSQIWMFQKPTGRSVATARGSRTTWPCCINALRGTCIRVRAQRQGSTRR